MLPAEQAGASAPTSYAMTLHRERQARLSRIASASEVVRAKVIDASRFWPVEILVYPVGVFAEDCEHASEVDNRRERVVTNLQIIRRIQNLICRNLDVELADLLSVRRDRRTVVARQVAVYLCKIHTPNSLPDLGRRFGGRDHTTMLHASRRVAATMAAPRGTAISDQWSVEACDFMRDAVNMAEITIATWREGMSSRKRYPSRSEK